MRRYRLLVINVIIIYIFIYTRVYICLCAHIIIFIVYCENDRIENEKKSKSLDTHTLGGAAIVVKRDNVIFTDIF